jgi:hypothetical protein
MRGISKRVETEKIELGKRIEAADLLGQAGDPRLEGDTQVTIPAGGVHIGAQKGSHKVRNYPQEAFDDESPVHEVKLPASGSGGSR